MRPGVSMEYLCLGVLGWTKAARAGRTVGLYTPHYAGWNPAILRLWMRGMAVASLSLITPSIVAYPQRVTRHHTKKTPPRY